LAFVNFSLTAMERMEGTVMVEVVEDAAKVLIVELEKNAEYGWWRNLALILCGAMEL
jgi:hypothetical protein